MADNEMSLIMRIRSLFDGSGSKQAADDVAEIGKASKAMSDTTRAAAGSTEKSFAAINAATAVTQGGVMGVGQAVKNLAGQFPSLNAALGPVGLALAAFAAWKKAIDAVRESSASLARGRFDTTIGNQEASVRSLARAYDELQRSISSAEDARKRLSDAESAKDDARLAADLAKLELAQAEAQAALDPGDAFGRRRVDLDFAARRSSVTDAAALRKADRELANIRGEGATQEATKRAAEETVKELQDRFSTLGAEYAARNAKTTRDIEAAWTPKGKQDAAERGEKDLARIAAAMESVAAKLTAATETRDAAERNLFTLGEKAEVNRMSRDALVTRQRTGQVNASMSGAELSRDVQAEQARLQRKLRDGEISMRDRRERDGELSQNLQREQADVRRVGETGKGDAAKEKKERDAALKALQDFRRDSTVFYSDLRAEMEKMREAIRNNPSQAQ